MTQPRQDDPEVHKTMTFGEHLTELRKRLVISLLAIAAGMLFFMIWKGLITSIVCKPYEDSWLLAYDSFHQTNVAGRDPARIEDVAEREHVVYWQLHDTAIRGGKYPGQGGFSEADHSAMRIHGFGLPRRLSSFTPFQDVFVWMSLAALLGFVAALPVVLYQMWQFIAAGLYKHERRVVERYVPLSIGLFLAGVVFGYLVMVPWAVYFLISLMDANFIAAQFSVQQYFSFLFTCTGALGLVFQLPLVMLALVKVGIVQPDFFTKYWRHSVVVIFIIAAVLTPPDPFTQSFMAIPMCALYGLGIFLCKAAGKRQAAAARSATP